MDTQTEVSVLHFIGTDGGDWLLAEFDWIEEVVSMMHRIKAKQVRAFCGRRRFLQGLSGVG